MSSPMHRLKINPTMISRLLHDQARMKSQLAMMADNPTAYTGEVFKCAISVLQWHLEEQEAYLDVLAHKAEKLNYFINQAEKLLEEEKHGK
ncbi:hypothetical protein A4G19_14475 [Pasteurellaceae bacterium Macca]|nr:hypothetical protein [Pasteurellaceae bacterium Macca]MCK3656004.1 hypothetical protein [Pasteurellaceae bacterium Macca]MCK3656105.1 hypothetical protein [Pasteurellaceae bacterium Macca]MCK3656126.1 hypothetical protein [Pasteurellaceae bacterium Macca]MCK3656144.1 hypothetical protein [Pasteurellaceae bacterium Macca]